LIVRCTLKAVMAVSIVDPESETVV
jgi:hypothetical protein